MGMTIHYRGTLSNLESVHELTAIVLDLARELDWEHTALDEDWTRPNTARIEYRNNGAHITGHLPLKGVILHPHPDCEGVDLTFAPDGRLADAMGMVLTSSGELTPEMNWVSCKTQFAPIHTHIAIIRLLRVLKERFLPDLEVEDEGGFWETGGLEVLAQRKEFLASRIETLRAAFEQEFPVSEEGISTEEAVKKVEAVIERLFGGEHGQG